MSNPSLTAIAGIGTSLSVSSAIAWAGSQDGSALTETPTFYLAGLQAFSLNWLMFVPAYLNQTERYFDLTGSLTFLSLIVLGLTFQSSLGLRDVLLAVLVSIWAVRLGWFLAQRIHKDREDRRFTSLKPSFPLFLMTWTLQGMWVFVTISCALAAITGTHDNPIGWVGWCGMGLWMVGFSFEVVADNQKRAFRRDPRNRNMFITQGLWAWSRHPNYFGEILLWVGIALLALPELTGWQLATLVSPVFVFILLTRVSGIPMLQARADEKWGHLVNYQNYKSQTPILIPWPPKSN